MSAQEKPKKSLVKKILWIVLITILSILGIIVLVFPIYNGIKYLIYKDYYSILSEVADNPGLNDGYVPQGLTYVDEADVFVTCGYMKDGSASRLYVVNPNNNEYYFLTLKHNGEDFKGHTGGIAYNDGDLLLANESDGVYRFSYSSIDEDNSDVDIGSAIPIGNNHSSFIFADDDYVYIGEFNDDRQYPTNNEYTYEGKTQRAIVEKFDVSDKNFNNVMASYSIPNSVQGCAITSSGRLVLSQSYGLNSSHIMVYSSSSMVKIGENSNGKPIYFLLDPEIDIMAPPMSEDLDYVAGKIVYACESASNKYYFGKFYLDYKIHGLKID
jgi:hypothetical protein